MASLIPLYTSDNCAMAYQSNWSLSIFPKVRLPPATAWISALRQATEGDDVRILEVTGDKVLQFLLSTKPHLPPQAIVRLVKGRLQYQIREEIPRAFHRNYRITSVGTANCKVLQQYIRRQAQRHPMADSRVQEMMESLQFVDATVDLSQVRRCGRGEFIYNLHVVLEHADGWCAVRREHLEATRSTIIRVCKKHGYLLPEIGLLCNHLHIPLGCCFNDPPQEVALRLLNNLAWVHGMVPIYRPSFFVGTFGPYDLNAIRRCLRGL